MSLYAKLDSLNKSLTVSPLEQVKRWCSSWIWNLSTEQEQERQKQEVTFENILSTLTKTFPPSEDPHIPHHTSNNTAHHVFTNRWAALGSNP
jgi:hypothetical protein